MVLKEWKLYPLWWAKKWYNFKN